MLRHVVHPYAPILSPNCKVLILGSVPSIKSIENLFYYGHPYNRFWPLLSELLDYDLVNSTSETKRKILTDNGIALYDVVFECDIDASDDTKVYNLKVNDIDALIKKTNIKRIFLNGNMAYKTFKSHFNHLMPLAFKLPSTSPRNAKYSLEMLKKDWKIIL